MTEYCINKLLRERKSKFYELKMFEKMAEVSAESCDFRKVGGQT